VRVGAFGGGGGGVGGGGVANERFPGKSIKCRTGLRRLKLNDAATQTQTPDCPVVKTSLPNNNGGTTNTNLCPTLQHV